MKKITLSDINLDMDSGTIMYVTIDVFRFVKDESLPCVEVEIEENGEYRLLEELEEEDTVVTHEELKKVAIKWLFNNVRIDDMEG